MSQSEVHDLYKEIDALAARDWQLWSIGALLFVVIAIGFAAFVLPNLVWASTALHADHRFLPQLFFGLMALIVLFNVYILDQKRMLHRTRERMVHQLVESAQASQVAIIDPLTGMFNRRYMDEIIPREVNRANRRGTEISFFNIDVDDFKSINTRFGHLGGDQYLKDVAALLKSTLRGSDTVLRLGGDEFLAILPETNNVQARLALARLHAEVERWNQTTEAKYKLAFSCGIATYQKGLDVEQVLRAADAHMYATKNATKHHAAQSIA